MKRLLLCTAAGLLATCSLATAQRPVAGGTRPPAANPGTAPGAGGVQPPAANPGTAPAAGGAQSPAANPGTRPMGGPPPSLFQPDGAGPIKSSGGSAANSGAANSGANFNRGQIVKVDPQTGMVTLRTGTGANAREQQFRVGNDARFFGPDRRALTNGLRFDGFRNGTDVWFRAGTGNTANSINDMRLFDPSSPVMSGRIMHGQIVNVDPNTGTITVRTGTGTDARDQQFRVGRDTRFFGRNLDPIADGLASNGFRNGAPVWFAPGTGGLSGTLSGVSLADPSAAQLADSGSAAGTAPAGSTPAAGSPGATGSTGATGGLMRGVIVMANAESGAITVRLGEGPNEREANLRVIPDTRFFGADRKPLTGGLSFRGFRPGADVWFQTSNGELTGNITNLSLSEPIASAEPKPMAPSAGGSAGSAGPSGTSEADAAKAGSKFVTGRVVTLDADGRTITVKTGSGDNGREQEFKVVADAEFFGPERQPLPEGLRFEGLRPGVTVWMRVGTGDLANTVRDLRMYDPSRPDKDSGDKSSRAGKDSSGDEPNRSAKDNSGDKPKQDR